MQQEIQVPESIDVPASDDAEQTGPDAPAEAQQVRLELDDSNAQTTYANMCLVSSTPEEVILDLALNQNPVGGQSRRIRIAQRVIINHYTAKRLAGLLTSAVQRHEAVFGVLETDVRKRVKPQIEASE